jgi:hypothetical protein
MQQLCTYTATHNTDNLSTINTAQPEQHELHVAAPSPAAFCPTHLENTLLQDCLQPCSPLAAPNQL